MKIKIIKTIKEHSAIIILVALFFIIPSVLRSIDSTSAAFDPGILHSVILACLIFAVFQICTWQVINVIWPDLGDYLKVHFSYDYKDLNKRTRMFISLGVYFFIFFQFSLILCAIL